MHASLKATLQKLFDVEYIVPAGRGSLGIYAALRAWAKNGIVAVPSAVCQDVIAAILMAGWKPLFCDVDPDTGLTKTSEWMRARNEGANAAIVVHLYGNAANSMDARAAFPNGLVIDDAAQALCARLTSASCYAGTGGNVGLISFGHSKQIEVGGAALFCQDSNLAKACAAELAAVLPATQEHVFAAELSFRAGFNVARQKLRSNGDITGFSGLLAGYLPAMRIAWHPEWSNPIEAAFLLYQKKLVERRIKANMWCETIAGTGLVPVGMGADSAPWRFACRLPDCDWQRQHKIGEAMRTRGLNVSHWYLPSHWLMANPAGNLPGVEKLAKESFQFWVDDSIDAATIKRSAKIFREIFDE